MMKSTGYVSCMCFAVISAMTAYPCQAQMTVKSPINVTETQNSTSTESPNAANTSASDLGENPNISKSVTVSELENTPPNSPPITTPPNQSARTNPLGCRFFDNPSMQQ